MSGGGSTSESTTQSSGTQAQQGQQSWLPHKAALPGYGFLGGNMRQLMQQPVPFFPGRTYVGPSTPTMGGVNQAMAAAQYAMPQVLGTAGGNYGFLSNAADVANNPYVQAMNAQTQQGLNQNLTENLLPQLNAGAQAVNALGSGRQGLAQGRAIGDTQQAIANAQTQTNLGAYGQGLGAQQYALGQTGNMLGNLLMPSQTMSNVGQQVEGYQQRALQDAIRRFQYQYAEPGQRMALVQNLLGTLQPLGTGYNNTFGQNQSTQHTQGSTQQQMGGMGMLQQGLGLVGSIAPLFMSDRRLKMNVKRVGKTPAGYPVYDFRYVWDDPVVRRRGVMADEVPDDWTTDVGGYKAVDYSKVR